MIDLIPVAQAQARLLALATPLDIERLPLGEAAGRWAAEPVPALRTQPELPLSAMDGYAIRFADLPGPWRMIGESAAGRPFAGDIAGGEASRRASRLADDVSQNIQALLSALDGDGPPLCGAHVRRAGLDFSLGDPLIAAGERLTPARIALAAMAGHATLPVRRRVRVAIAATGDELRPPGATLETGQLTESNGTMLAAMLADLPVTLIDLGILPDRHDALAGAFAAVDADLLVATGGASVGDHDLVRPALEASGATIDFWPGDRTVASALLSVGYALELPKWL